MTSSEDADVMPPPPTTQKRCLGEFSDLDASFADLWNEGDEKDREDDR